MCLKRPSPLDNGLPFRRTSKNYDRVDTSSTPAIAIIHFKSNNFQSIGEPFNLKLNCKKGEKTIQGLGIVIEYRNRKNIRIREFVCIQKYSRSRFQAVSLFFFYIGYLNCWLDVLFFFKQKKFLLLLLLVVGSLRRQRLCERLNDCDRTRWKNGVEDYD